jgi:malate dehydrogenase (oxaloacetate-decarboxylating)(NADP+)
MMERERLNIRGLLPPRVRSLQSQKVRVLEHLREMKDNASKNLYLQDLHSRNETLYHRLLVDHIEEIAPLIYTPTVGEVCEKFGRQFFRARGMYFTREDRGHFSSMVYNWPHDDVHVIVVTDGSRILGLGDLGAHGMGIPIGKLALYCGAGGIAPHRVLPVVLDVGTNNQKLLADPGYLGVPEPRLEGEEYFDMLDEFMQAVFGRWPNVVVQFEDFATPKAVSLLAKYRHQYRCFNDDIQGTGCVTLSCMLSAARNAGSKLTDMKFVCAGAGSAGLGVCSQILEGMVEAGMDREEARRRFILVTANGCLGTPNGKFGDPNHKAGLSPERELPWVNPMVADGASMLDAVEALQPTCLLGLSATANVFTEAIVRKTASMCRNPIIMPMSNPTSKAECTPLQAYTWSNGRAIVATGSPFAPVLSIDLVVVVVFAVVVALVIVVLIKFIISSSSSISSFLPKFPLN